ncbi:MAG: hypothetical protein HY827_03565 [Actinobacteria bacterium]|nr:hypothetical protein [Actinomycetota bacterium]
MSLGSSGGLAGSTNHSTAGTPFGDITRGTQVPKYEEPSYDHGPRPRRSNETVDRFVSRPTPNSM